MSLDRSKLQAGAEAFRIPESDWFVLFTSDYLIEKFRADGYWVFEQRVPRHAWVIIGPEAPAGYQGPPQGAGSGHLPKRSRVSGRNHRSGNVALNMATGRCYRGDSGSTAGTRSRRQVERLAGEPSPVDISRRSRPCEVHLRLVHRYDTQHE
jgi:hypothetical protein